MHKLSLLNAILVNINIMLGSGIFINTVLLAQNAGSLSPLTYFIVGCLIFPLIYTLAYYMRIQSGTFYDFGSNISPFYGFFSSWSYFIAKIASAVLNIHIFVTLMQQLFPLFSSIPTLIIDIFILSFFIWLNRFNMRMGSSIQYSFIILKLVPLLFAIISGIFLFKASFFTSTSFNWSGIPLSFPLVIFAFSGFEASCSLSKNIENPEKNGPRAIFIAYSIVLFLVVLYQLLIFGSLGDQLISLSSFKNVYPLLISKLAGISFLTKDNLIALMHIGIASSALGASYGILYSNSWNLYSLAINRHMLFSNLLSRFNKHNVPYWSVLTQGFIGLFYLLISQGQQVYLQQISALGATIAYSISALSLAVLLYKRHKRIPVFVWGALLSCLLFIGATVYAFALKGAFSLMIFTPILLIGLSCFWYQSKAQKKALK